MQERNPKQLMQWLIAAYTAVDEGQLDWLRALLNDVDDIETMHDVIDGLLDEIKTERARRGERQATLN
jgi:hypothetical protein